MRNRSASIAIVLAAPLAAGFLTSCASKQPAKSTTTAVAPSGTVVVVNTICPIAGDDFARHEMPVTLSREWKGTRIGFCCDHCPPKFDKMTDAQKDTVRGLALANKAPENPDE